MEVQSRLETILMTRVSTYVGMFMDWAFGWFLRPAGEVITQTCHDINILFFHNEEEVSGLDDNQLSMLGLDVDAVNDDEQYWNYSTRTRRR